MSEKTTLSVTLKVEGMSCEHCVGRVQKALDATPGVVAATVDLAAGTASVQIVDDAGSGDVIAAIEKAGYAARTP